MNTLAPDGPYGEDFFKEIVAHAVATGLELPWVGSDSDEVYQWLHDSLRDLILRVLNNDPSLSQDIRDGLLRDLEEFERENALNQALSAGQRAANILQRTAFLEGELSRWATAVGKGLSAAFSGTSRFTWAKSAFENASANIDLPGKNRLMGFATVALVLIASPFVFSKRAADMCVGRVLLRPSDVEPCRYLLQLGTPQ